MTCKSLILLALLLIFGVTGATFGQPRIFPLSGLKTDNWKSSNNSDPLSDFPEKGLPEAAIIGANPSYQSGADAARRILKFDDDALPLLIAALQKGGFYILDEKDKVLYMPRSGPGLDIGFFDFEVAGMLRGVGFGYGSSIAKLAKTYAGDGSQMSSSEVARRMLVDLRAMRNSKDPHIQFVAGMLFEMSRISPENGDLANGSANSIKLNMIQASLIERLVMLDLLTQFENLSGTATLSFPIRNPFKARTATFTNASWTAALPGVCDVVADISTLKKTYKTGKKVVDTVKVYNELSKDIGTLDKIKNSQVVKGASVVNAALAWAKTIMAFLNVVATFELEQPMPLIRTKESGNRVGQIRNTKIKVVMNFNHSDFINCMATALGTVSDISFSVPKGGPLSGVGVSWEVLVTSKSTGFWAALFNRDYDKYTSVPTFIDALDRGDISRQFTDDKGENTVKLTGKPQPEDLTNQPVVPLPKKVNLRAKVALDKIDAKKDIPKIIKIGLGPSIDPFSILEFVADLVAKIPLKSYDVMVPVRDWQPCSGDWGGTINYKRELKQTIVVKGSKLDNGNSTGNGVRQINELDEASITLNPRSKAEIEAKADRKSAMYYVNGKHSDVFSGKREADPCCGPVEGKFDVSFRSGTEFTYSSVFTNQADLRISAGQRDFSIALGLSAPAFKVMNREFLEIENTNCPVDKESAFDEYKEGMFAIGDSLPDGRHGERYVDETGEIMVGSKTLTGPDNASITWRWELARCGK